jgi:hypothetical protein
MVLYLTYTIVKGRGRFLTKLGVYYRFLGLEYKSRMEKHFTQESSRHAFSYIYTNREQEERQRL